MSNPAEGYEGYMVPTLFAPWASRLVQAANPQPSEQVLGLDDAARQAMLEAIRDDMQAPLRAVTQGDHVVIPFHAYVASARR